MIIVEPRGRQSDIPLVDWDAPKKALGPEPSEEASGTVVKDSLATTPHVDLVSDQATQQRRTRAFP